MVSVRSYQRRPAVKHQVRGYVTRKGKRIQGYVRQGKPKFNPLG